MNANVSIRLQEERAGVELRVKAKEEPRPPAR
jgi:hypothetical protein